MLRIATTALEHLLKTPLHTNYGPHGIFEISALASTRYLNGVNVLLWFFLFFAPLEVNWRTIVNCRLANFQAEGDAEWTVTSPLPPNYWLQITDVWCRCSEMLRLCRFVDRLCLVWPPSVA